jgi:hypothetical protein
MTKLHNIPNIIYSFNTVLYNQKPSFDFASPNFLSSHVFSDVTYLAFCSLCQISSKTTPRLPSFLIILTKIIIKFTYFISSVFCQIIYCVYFGRLKCTNAFIAFYRLCLLFQICVIFIPCLLFKVTRYVAVFERFIDIFFMPSPNSQQTPRLPQPKISP